MGNRLSGRVEEILLRDRGTTIYIYVILAVECFPSSLYLNKRLFLVTRISYLT